MPTENKKQIDYIPDSWVKYRHLWQWIDDIVNELALVDRSRLKDFLVRKFGERTASYDFRLDTAVFEDRVSPAVRDFAGLLSQFTVNDETPNEITDQFNDVDGLKTNFDVWVNRMIGNSLTFGCYGWMVSYVAEVDQWFLRFIDPRAIAAPKIIPNEVTKIPELKGVTIVTAVQKEDGYSTKDVVQYWRHELDDDGFYFYEVYEKDGDEFRLETEMTYPLDAGRNRLTEIPLVWINTDNDKHPLAPNTPFFYTLARLNVLQFNKRSEINVAESNLNIQTLKRKHSGEVPDNPDDIYTGPDAVIEVPNAQYGGDVEVLEPAGTAIITTEQRNNARDERMDRMARQFLTGTESEKTAYQVNVELDSYKAQLLTLQSAIQDSIQTTFQYIHQFTDPRPQEEVGGIMIDEKSISDAITEGEIRLLLELYEASIIPNRESLIEIYSQRGLFSDETKEMLLERLEQERELARQERERQERLRLERERNRSQGQGEETDDLELSEGSD